MLELNKIALASDAMVQLEEEVYCISITVSLHTSMNESQTTYSAMLNKLYQIKIHYLRKV